MSFVFACLMKSTAPSRSGAIAIFFTQPPARSEDPRVTHVSAALSSIYEEVLVVATDGTLAADIRPLVRLSISVLVEEDGKRERGSCGSGGRFGLDWFFEVVNGDIRAVNFAKEAVRQALVNLSAVAAPAGLMPVVLRPWKLFASHRYRYQSTLHL